MGPSLSLTAAAAGGDAAATAELLQTVWPDAYRIAWSVLRNRAAAEDAAQEACARVATTIAALRRPESFAVWFYRIVVNESQRARRRTGREVPLAGDLPDSEGLAHEDRLDLRNALDLLDPVLRLVVVMRYYFGLNSAEIATVLGSSPITIRWRLLVARRRLRSMLSPNETPSSTLSAITGE